jgi:SpoVK/Ycf46/Vps4 family AAA+-type ATPase
MLEGGLVLPRQVKIADVYHGASLREDYGAERRSKPRVLVKLLSGAGARRFDHATLSRYIGDALLKRAAPVVIVDETALPSSPTLSMTADVVCACAGLDHALLAELLHTVLGIAPKRSFPKMAEMALDLEGLSIDDLTLAIRSGRDLDATLASLAALAEQARAGGESEEGKEDAAAGGKDGSGQSKTSKSGKGSSAAKTRPTGDAVDIIQPAKPPSATLADRMVAEAGSLEPVKSMGHSYLSIETLSGYGEARQWALDLKVDIDVWRHAELSWSDMSTKLLLSGPPGTGKTTYARALSNTLQVPLLVTSVAAWLEPGYLGDVLKRMSHAFETARQQAPAILFIDEIDNIGSRGGSRRDYDDYWRSLINRLLELLDGASKTEGVIVVAATNLPETIDPALLRSGRLEKHVAIPLPDIGALGGILAHHLGADLATVLSTAPIPPISRRLRPRQARDHDPQQLRKSAARRKAREIKGAPQ